MTEPDEDQLWGKNQSAIRSGYFLHAYRAGQAASAERIKWLKEALIDAVGQHHYDALIEEADQ